MQRVGNIIGGVMPTGGTNTASREEARPSVQAHSPDSSRASGRSLSAGSSERAAPMRRRRLGVSTDFALIKGILSKALAGKGLDKKIDRYEFVLHWDKIVGEKLAEVSKPEYISRSALIVRVMHPVWAQELTFMKAHLLQKLAPYLKRGDRVDEMIFRIGPMAG